MGLRRAKIAIQFATGLVAGHDDKTVAPTQLLTLENGVFDEDGTVIKRFGYLDLGKAITGTVDTLPAGRALAKRDNELLILTNDELYGYLPSIGEWRDSADVQSVILSHRVVAKTTSEQTGADYAVLDGVAVYAWEDSRGGIYYSVLEDATGKVIVRPTQVTATGIRPRVQAIGNQLHIFYVSPGDHRLFTFRISPSNPTVTSSPTVGCICITEDVNQTHPNYDVDAEVGGTKAAIAWWTIDSTIRVGYITQDGVFGSPATGLPSPIAVSGEQADAGIGVTFDQDGTNQIGVAWGSLATGATEAAYLVRDSDLTEALAPTVLHATPGDIDNITLSWQRDNDSAGERTTTVFYEVTAAAARDHTVLRRSANAAGTVGTASTQRGAGLATKAYQDSEHVYVGIVHETTLFTTYFVQRDDGLVVARLLSGVAGGVTSTPHLPSVSTASRLASWATIYKVALESVDNDVFTEKGIRKVSADFNCDQSHQSAQLGRSAYIAGGMLQYYDADGVVEAGFHYAPDDVTTPTQAGPGSVDIGTHVYRSLYEWTNAQGELEQGPISAGTTVVVAAATKKVIFGQLPTYRLTAKTDPRTEASIAVFRTAAGESTYYRVTSLDPSATGNNGYVTNDPTADSVAFTDDLSDADLLKQEPLYTNGGILSNDPTPCGAVVAAGKDRIFVNDPGDPNVIYYSQQLREGYTAEFSPRLQVRLDPYGGAITAIKEMDDAIIVFKENAVFFFAGDGPLANPDAGGGFSAPQLITSDVGCIAIRSVEYTPAGLVFQSHKGIYLLDRSRTVRYIGKNVEEFNAQSVVSTELIEDRTQIRLLTDSGVTLVWDYYHDRWSVFTNHEGLDAIVVGGVYHYLRNGGDVWQESSAYADGTQQIKLIIATAWIKFQDHLQGFCRIWRALFLGKYVSDHTVRVRAAYDYELGWTDLWDDIEPDDFYSEGDYGDGNYGDGNYGGEGDALYQFSVHVGHKCEAVKFQIEDVEDAADHGASFELTELLLTGGVKAPDYKMSDARRN